MKNNSIKIIVFLFGITLSMKAQQSYKIHSHNDYLQQVPFWKAYKNGAASIEADVFLNKNELLVAHTKEHLAPSKTLKKLYLDPLVKISKHGKLKDLQLLIDVKTKAKPTLKKLLVILKSYPTLTNNTHLKFVISGHRPAPGAYKNYPDFIQFDHQNMANITKINLKKVALVSQDFSNYTIWNGLESPTATELKKIKAPIEKAHKVGKKFRFWGSPDTKIAWRLFFQLGVDFINTDHPAEAFAYLKKLNQENITKKK